MVLANVATLLLCNLHYAAVLLFQEPEGGIGWDPISLWKQMGVLAKIVVVILFLMSGWSIGIMIDRWMAFSAARNQSRSFAPAVAGALKEGKIDEAIKVAAAERNKKSHLARVVAAGLQEYNAQSGWAGHYRLDCSIRGPVRHRHRHHQCLPRDVRVPCLRPYGRRGRHLGGAGDHGHWPVRRCSGRLDVQL